MKKLNKKGFTLIELLAVIVILAIILIIAVPSVTGLIDDAKKDSFLSTARMMKSAASLYTSTENVVLPSEDLHAVVITAAALKMDNLGKDPDGNAYDAANSYIAMVYSSSTATITYYVTLVSTAANSRGLYFEVVDNLARTDVFADKATTVVATISTITVDTGAWSIGGQSLVVDSTYDGS